MFEKLKAKLEALAEKKNEEYKSKGEQFDDVVATKTDWSPLKSGGSNFKTHNLVKVSLNLMRYQLSMGGKFFIGIFGLVGLGVTLIGINMFISKEGSSFFLIIFGIIFTGVSIIMYKTMGKPVSFDASMEFIWFGHKPPKFAGDNSNTKNMIYFNDIHAIQVLSERVSGNKSSYTSYEINMVLNDGTRFNVMDHGSHSQILLDAEDLSVFLGKPVWDIS